MNRDYISGVYLPLPAWCNLIAIGQLPNFSPLRACLVADFKYAEATKYQLFNIDAEGNESAFATFSDLSEAVKYFELRIE
jgi:hypothetical protein